MNRKSIKYIVFTQRTFYFLLFSSIGIIAPYFSLYLKSIGLQSKEIGFIFMLFSINRIISPPVWHKIEEKYHNTVSLIRISAFFSSLFFGIYFFVKKFWYIVVASFLFHFFRSAVILLNESLTLVYTKKYNLNYGKIRLFGSIGFMVASIVSGFILHFFPIKSILYMVFIVLIANFMVSLYQIPIPKTHYKKETSRIYNLKPFLLFILIAHLIWLNESAYYPFFSIYMKSIGASPSLLGFSFALAVFSEIIFMFFFENIIQNVRKENFLRFVVFTTIFRWGIIYLIPNPYVITFFQVLHAITFGGYYLVSMKLINEFSGGKPTKALSIFSMATFGLGGALGSSLSGIVVSMIGIRNLFLVMSINAVFIFILSLFFKANTYKESQNL